MSQACSALLRKSLDAFARLDTDTALAIIKEDDFIDQEYDGFLRKLMTYIMEDPRTISPSLNLLFLAKAIDLFVLFVLSMFFPPFGFILGLFYLSFADSLKNGQSIECSSKHEFPTVYGQLKSIEIVELGSFKLK